MKDFARLFFRRVWISLLAACLVFLGILMVHRLVDGFSIERQSIKSILARAIIGCAHASKKGPVIDCQAVFQNMNAEVKELGFQIWVEDKSGALLWRNTEEPAPVISRQFSESGNVYTTVGTNKKFTFALKVPSGYVDDADTKVRVIVGSPLPGNSTPYLRNRILGLIFFLFILGVLFSSALSFYVLSKRAHEAQRIYLSLSAGDLSARFKVGRLDELSDLSTSFNQMVDLLAKSIQNIQLSEANRRALASELSHDLRTPLTSLTSFVQLLNNEKTPESIKKECLISISTEMSYLNQLVDALFELSRIESPQTKAERGVVDALEILKSIENDFKLASKVRNIQFDSNLSVGEAWILGDAFLAKRMICNLMDNAFRYARSKVYFHSQLDEERKVLKIKISDDGPGFFPEQLKEYGVTPGKRNLSEASDQIHLGLGSVIAMKILNLHDGRMEVSNQSTGGALIEIELNLVSVLASRFLSP